MVRLIMWKKQDSVKGLLPADLVVSLDKTISAEQVQEICASVGWTRREVSLIARALENSLAVASVWEKGRLIAFARATGDKVFNATVWDVVVRPSYQGMGLGVLVMNALLKELDSYNIPLITLYADPGTDGFYKRFGFLGDPAGVRGMFREKF
jgi:GNAT superfamily N-acetyltransferase